MNVVFILNGEFDKEYDLQFFQNYQCIVCIDGGYVNFQKLKMNIEPDYLIGDFDSMGDIDIKNIKSEKTKIVYKDNQDETDAQFAYKYISKELSFKNIKTIDYIYAISSSRFDHSLCNILLLKQIPSNINARILSKTQEMFLLRNKVNIMEKVGKTLSIIPLTNVKGLTIKGCKWDLDNTDVNFGFIGGISNIIEKNNAEISLKEGECAIIITYELL
jgi:thiamine pyrophosphokinase